MGKTSALEAIDILLVDDHEENLLSLEAVLESPDYNLIRAGSSDEASRYLLEHEPALILMAAQALNLDGFAALSTIKSNPRTREIPVIVISAISEDEAFVHKSYSHGAVDCLQASHDPHILRSKVAIFAALARKNRRLLAAERQVEQGKYRDLIDDTKERSDFLAAASLFLAESFDYVRNLRRVGERAVPRHADWFGVELFGADPALEGESESRGSPGSLSIRVPEKVAQPVGETILLPLETRGRAVGRLTLVSAPGARGGAADLAMAEDLARRISAAVDNAYFYAQAQAAIRARDEFLSIASHELKTPLTPLKIQTQMLMRSLKNTFKGGLSPERLERMVQVSDRQLGRLSQLVDELLDVSRIDGGKLNLAFEEFDLCEVTRSVVERFRDQLEAAGCEVKMNAQGRVMVNWDRFRIEQMLTNLLTNAMKYGAGEPVEIRIQAEDPIVRISFRDHGIGIAKEDQQRIFRRFERAASGNHFGGLGLGLYIVTQILEAHEGRIRVESEMGKGSEFIVEIPMRPISRSVPRSERGLLGAGQG